MLYMYVMCYVVPLCVRMIYCYVYDVNCLKAGEDVIIVHLMCGAT